MIGYIWYTQNNISYLSSYKEIVDKIRNPFSNVEIMYTCNDTIGIYSFPEETFVHRPKLFSTRIYSTNYKYTSVMGDETNFTFEMFF